MTNKKQNINPKTGFPHGSIGDLSIRLGQDVRELIISGYTWDQINEMIRKKEAAQAKGAGNNKTG